MLPIFPATTRILSRIFRMDAIDRKILAELQQDGRISVTDLAQKVGLSLSPCHRRLRALEAGGVITGYAPKIDAAAVGLQFSAIVFVCCATPAARACRPSRRRCWACRR